MALGRLSIEEQFGAQCDGHGRIDARAARSPTRPCTPSLTSPLTPCHGTSPLTPCHVTSPLTPCHVASPLRQANACVTACNRIRSCRLRLAPHMATSDRACIRNCRDLATAVRVWEHGQALQLVTAVTKEDLTNSIAANNKALCLMYGRDLATAVRVLEDQLQASPLTAVDETVVLNLCSMYELAASDTLNAKSTLSNWLTRLAPDDFDFACTRL
ncbi:unnamed protein product [Closterium sp. Yama58-4]|nr:unnamed protein product [Closterium sp. Yama58-4]